MTDPGNQNSQSVPDESDLIYQQARVLLLITAVSSLTGHNRRLDGLTKLAKLDFLTRYPGLAAKVLPNLEDLQRQAVERDAESESPMIRYKYGPWDHRYYPVIGALVGRGLVRYVKGRQGSIAFTPTAQGRKVAQQLAATPDWQEMANRCRRVAEASERLTGNALKELIYANLPEVVDLPRGAVIR